MALSPQNLRTFFVTSNTTSHRALLQSDRMARLLIDCLLDNRCKGRFQLHAFVIMPTHFHALLTPAPEVSLEKAMQYIKGGFSYRARKELSVNYSIWQASFTEHRIRDRDDYASHVSYIHENPVQARLVATPEQFPYSTASLPGLTDQIPAWLSRSALALSR